MTLQEELILIKNRHKLSYSWIAEQLHTYPPKIQYAFEVAKDIPFSLYAQIMDLFERYNLIDDSKEKYDNLISQTFLTNQIIAESIKKLNYLVNEFSADNKFTSDERRNANEKFTQFKNEINKTLDKLIKLTEIK